MCCAPSNNIQSPSKKCNLTNINDIKFESSQNNCITWRKTHHHFQKYLLSLFTLQRKMDVFKLIHFRERFFPPKKLSFAISDRNLKTKRKIFFFKQNHVSLERTVLWAQSHQHWVLWECWAEHLLWNSLEQRFQVTHSSCLFQNNQLPPHLLTTSESFLWKASLWVIYCSFLQITSCQKEGEFLRARVCLFSQLTIMHSR